MSKAQFQVCPSLDEVVAGNSLFSLLHQSILYRHQHLMRTRHWAREARVAWIMQPVTLRKGKNLQKEIPLRKNHQSPVRQAPKSQINCRHPNQNSLKTRLFWLNTLKTNSLTIWKIQASLQKLFEALEYKLIQLEMSDSFFPRKNGDLE